MKSFLLPEIYFMPLLRKALLKLKILKFFEALGISFTLKPFSKTGALGPRYSKRFVDKYFVKMFYSKDQLKYLPKFPLCGAHKNRRMIVFGNGPSLRKFDFSNIKEALTIGTNRSSEFYHADYVLISGPYALMGAQPYFDFEKSTLLVGGGLWNGRIRKDMWSKYENRVIPFDFDAWQNWDITGGKLIGTGPVCGTSAIDAAILMGAASILVVGCDGYKGRKMEEMYAGDYMKVYKKALASRQSIESYRKMLWDREEDVHKKYCLRQQYCKENGIRFCVWGEDNTYDRLNRISDDELKEWC